MVSLIFLLSEFEGAGVGEDEGGPRRNGEGSRATPQGLQRGRQQQWYGTIWPCIYQWLNPFHLVRRRSKEWHFGTSRANGGAQRPGTSGCQCIEGCVPFCVPSSPHPRPPPAIRPATILQRLVSVLMSRSFKFISCWLDSCARQQPTSLCVHCSIFRLVLSYPFIHFLFFSFSSRPCVFVLRRLLM